jgi:hypothetical protein
MCLAKGYWPTNPDRRTQDPRFRCRPPPSSRPARRHVRPGGDAITDERALRFYHSNLNLIDDKWCVGRGEYLGSLHTGDWRREVPCHRVVAEVEPQWAIPRAPDGNPARWGYHHTPPSSQKTSGATPKARTSMTPKSPRGDTSLLLRLSLLGLFLLLRPGIGREWKREHDAPLLTTESWTPESNAEVSAITVESRRARSPRCPPSATGRRPILPLVNRTHQSSTSRASGREGTDPAGPHDNDARGTTFHAAHAADRPGSTHQRFIQRARAGADPRGPPASERMRGTR